MVKNHLKSVKDVTAPLNWKSSPDSPETQLAYVTQDEIDMMVDANIHGSMDGKPNVGPKGIISLDGAGSSYRGSRSSGSKSTSTSSGGYDTKGGPDVPSDEEKERNRREKERNRREYLAELERKHAAEDSAKEAAKKEKIRTENKRRIEEARKERAGEAIPTIAEERAASGQVDKVKKAVREAQLKRSGAARFYPEFAKDYDESYDSLNLTGKLENLSDRISDADLFLQNYINYPSILGMGVEMFKSFGLDKEKIMKKIMNKEPLSRNEEQAIAGLLAAQKRNANVIPKLGATFRWGFPGYKNLIMGSDEDFQGWKGFKTDKEYERMIDEYYEGKPGGLGDLFGLLEGRKEGEGDTLEELRDKLTSGEEHYLKTNRPDLYYKFNTPQTSGGIADLAGQQLMSTEGLGGEDLQRAKDFNQQVFNARNELDRQWGDDGQGGGQEVASMPTFTDVNNNGILDYLETAETGTTGTGITGTSAGNQLAFASPGKIGYMTPEGYQWGTTGEYSPYAEVNLQNIRNGGIVGLYNGGYLNNSNGVIGLDGGGYLDDYKAADSLMFKDPQEDEEWEYNV
jgi:hypothetical protein